MRKYEQIQHLSGKAFRRLVGVKKKTFEMMLACVAPAEAEKQSKGGRPNRLCLADRLLMCLEYWREYRTYFHLGQSYGISESACYRTCVKLEQQLIRHPKFRLPGKKALYDKNRDEMLVLDVTETPVQRPKKSAGNKRNG